MQRNVSSLVYVKLTRVDLNLNRINPMFVNGVSSGYTKVNEAIERESELFVIATL